MSERLDTRARRLVSLKTDYQEKKREAEKAERLYRDIERELWEELEDEFGKVKSVKLDLGEGYGVVQLQRRETVTGRVLNDAEAAAALEAMGLGEAVLGSPQVRQRVLSEYVRDWLASGQPLPPGIDFNARRYIAVSRSNKP